MMHGRVRVHDSPSFSGSERERERVIKRY
jgi:hypothetical protein